VREENDDPDAVCALALSIASPGIGLMTG